MKAASYARMVFDRHRFGGFHDCPSWCWLEILRLANSRFAVIATEPPENLGTSVTNAFELLATDVCNRFDIDPGKLAWIEHYGYVGAGFPAGPREFHRVRAVRFGH